MLTGWGFSAASSGKYQDRVQVVSDWIATFLGKCKFHNLPHFPVGTPLLGPRLLLVCVRARAMLDKAAALACVCMDWFVWWGWLS